MSASWRAPRRRYVSGLSIRSAPTPRAKPWRGIFGPPMADLTPPHRYRKKLNAKQSKSRHVPSERQFISQHFRAINCRAGPGGRPLYRMLIEMYCRDRARIALPKPMAKAGPCLLWNSQIWHFSTPVSKIPQGECKIGAIFTIFMLYIQSYHHIINDYKNYAKYLRE